MLSVQTNILAENAARQFQINTKRREKNAEKLASGYKINRAADDAAGLSISEKMRRQIRGLKQGSENINEGISLIKVADSALGEITDMLQRINELSVKAYNGTNTEQDRQDIQAEVNQLLEEIGRTGETTTYNEMQILKWEPSFERKVKITEDKKVVLPVTVNETYKSLPEWLDKGVDNKLESHNYGSLGNQDTDGIMVTLMRDANGNVVRNPDNTAKYVYYGPNKGNHYGYFQADYAGAWTQDLSDNATAKVSFAGLKDISNFSELYSGVADLLGSGFGIPCGTCRELEYGLTFSGGVDGISVKGIAPYLGNKNTPDLNLNTFTPFQNADGENIDCFTYIKNKLQEANEQGLSETEQNNFAKNVADDVAQALCKEAARLMSEDQGAKGHYTKSFQSGKYDIIVYDFRDNLSLTWEHAADTTVRKWTNAQITYPTEVLEEGMWGTMEIPHDLYIVCSAQESDDIPVELPYVSLEALEIESYNVANYQRKERYSETYQKKMDEWEQSAYIVSTPHTEKVAVYKTERQLWCENGEVKVKTKVTPNGEREFTRWETKKVYPYDKPKPQDGDIFVEEWYDPSDNRLIRDALITVSAWRANLGATQNRLEHTHNNNGNKEENLTAAESRIRDTDIAKEMVAYANQNILQQAGVSMMAQANQDRQFILGLLQ